MKCILNQKLKKCYRTVSTIIIYPLVITHKINGLKIDLVRTGVDINVQKQFLQNNEILREAFKNILI